MIKHMFFIVLVLFFYNASAQKDYYPPRQKILSLKEIEEKKVLEKKLTTYEFEKLVRLIKPYQKLPPFVQFHTSGGRNVIDKERQDSFLFSSKLPSIPAEFEWKKNHSIDEAMDIYGKYCEENKTHPYLDVYQQYYGWLLMTRYDMLSDTSKQNMDNVALLIGNMIDVKYKGYQLLYYSLAFLKTSTHNEKKVKEFATAIEQYGALDTSYVNAQLYLKNPSKTGNRFMDEAFGKYYTQLLENKKGLDAIIEMNK